jgi:hypothetical protein
MQQPAGKQETTAAAAKVMAMAMAMAMATGNALEGDGDGDWRGLVGSKRQTESASDKSVRVLHPGRH